MKPNRKLKKAVPPPKLKLERVVGLSTKNANGLVSNGSTSNCVYVAGCVVVVYNVESGTQSHLMVPNRTPKPLYCVAMSNDGRFIAAGESGPQSALLVWDSASFAFLSELKSHQHGVECVAFSPNGKHLVSVGFPHDGFICLWDWRSGMLITKLKAVPSCSSVVSVCFSSDAKFIVTAGKKHLKFWKIVSSPRPRGTRAKCLTMHGKPINLGNQKGCSFIAVTSPVLADSDLVNCDQACETLPMYALTDAGLLCIIHSGLSIGNSVDIKVRKAFAMSASSKLIACACNNGVIKLFTLESLKYSGSLCYDEVTQHKKADGINRHIESSKKDLQLLPTLPHAIACQFSNSEKLVVVYGDHSLYVWDIHDLDKATSCHVLVSHCACIGNIKYLPCENKHDAALACVDRGCFGDLSLSTCSEDGIKGLWDHAQAVSPVNDPTLATSHNFGMKPVKSMSVMFRDAAITGTDCKISRCNPQMASWRTVDERTIEPTMNVVVTVGQDKKINISSIASGKLIRSFKQGGDFGDPIKVIVDPSSSLLVCAYSNMSIYIYDFFTGVNVARAVGHGEVITDMSFSTECKHIVSVDGDGCNFIWKVPTSLSSKMLHKIMENPRPLSLTSTGQPVALNQMKFNEVDHQSKINSKEVTQSESTTPVIHRLSAQRGCLQEISVFKFSISRLPKWAQAKITSPQITPLDSDYSTSQKIGNFLSVCSHGCVDVQTPSKDEQEGCEPFLGSFSRFSSDTSDTDTSLGSRLSLITHRRSFSLDRRWLTIHNVCLDLLTSPCVCDNEDKKVMVNIPRDMVAEFTNDVDIKEGSSRDLFGNKSSMEPITGHSNHVARRGLCSTENTRLASHRSSCPSTDQLEMNNRISHHHFAVSEVSDQFQSEKTIGVVQATKDANSSCMRPQDDGMLKQNLSCLSAHLKTEKRKSSATSNYLIQYALGQDLGGQKKLFDPPIREPSQTKETTTHTKFVDSLCPVVAQSQRTETCAQDNKKLAPNGWFLSQRSANCSTMDNPGLPELSNNHDQQKTDLGQCKKQNAIIACKEALLYLEKAADNVFQLFSTLGSLTDREDCLREFEADLYNEAAAMLPSLAKKIDAVAKIAQSTNKPL